jgi:hypothetical protein
MPKSKFCLLILANTTLEGRAILTFKGLASLNAGTGCPPSKSQSLIYMLDGGLALDRSLSTGRNPELGTFPKVIKALGIHLHSSSAPCPPARNRRIS